MTPDTITPRPAKSVWLPRAGDKHASAVARRASVARDYAYRVLARDDAILARLIRLHGEPDPYAWTVLEAVAGDAFAELALHIISQQISTAAATSIYARLKVALGGGAPTPALILLTPAQRLRSAGLSGAKARSIRDLAQRIADGRLTFARLATMNDDAAETQLREVLGIGPWSAQMFLLHYYRRPDILPAADIGLLRAAQSAFSLPKRPTAKELAARAEGWRPFRSYGAALLWAHGNTTAQQESKDGYVAA